MSTRTICLWAMLALLVLTVSAQAFTWANWTGAAGDRDWNNAANWDTGVVPPPLDVYAVIDSLSGPIVYKGMDVVVDRVYAGSTTEGLLIVDGGRLTVSSDIYLTRGDNAIGTVNLYGGVIEDISGGTNFNWKGKGVLNMYGGSFLVDGNVSLVSGQASCDTTLNLYGGIMNVGGFNAPPETRVAALVNVQGATLLLSGDDTEAVQALIDDGVLKAYNGEGDLSVDFDERNPGKTTITATHPLAPNPIDGSILWPGDVELSWTLPADAIKVDVWFSEDADKIFNADPSALVVDQKKVTTVQVTTEMKKRYYWAVDVYTGSDDDPNYGPLFSFLADNAPPVVNAGVDVDTFLIDGLRTGPLSGSVQDDGKLQPYTVEWAVLEQPSDENDPNNPDDPNNVASAVIADPAAEQTTVTVSAVGTYVLQLSADDGEYMGQDKMVIRVHEDGGID